MWVLLVAFGLLGIGWFIVWIVGFSSAVSSFSKPKERERAAEEKQEAVANGEKRKTEVLNADRDGLLARFRKRVRGK